MKLISMVDFVLEFGKEQNRCNYEEAYDKISAYARFLKQPLELWMFVPCDDNGNVININNRYETENNHLNIELDNSFIQAKERVLFVWKDGYDYNTICEMFLSIEDIINFQFELTQTAIKKLGL